jgi:hypothetical protein
MTVNTSSITTMMWRAPATMKRKRINGVLRVSTVNRDTGRGLSSMTLVATIQALRCTILSTLRKRRPLLLR